ncbi:MAG TPA: hypothetical protein DCS07_03790 [Bdellovibrionales bacterium]|nr:MAG: hypothetical protein A2X97_05845 [Bdellovibrionales bacterium GWA1_52_35]OFZ41353.1 MAG: hypothetical protein A2070_05185 [Bdellovibrionales bacterium GWC1_52_8]HAR41740.1 hypothetical protein [Bdellovibrionales bacterium]HCM41051.1 hypothetical protein [Bdellovibrionales bacterium]
MTKSSFATLADAEDFRISCSTFEATPKSCGGPVASNGAFNVSCDGFAAIPFGCFVYNTATFNNYPITFNVNSTDEKSAMNVAATTITGIDLVIDTDTGTATAAATITNPDTIEEVVVDADAFNGFNGPWTLLVKSYADAASKYSDADWTMMKNDYCRKNYWNTCGGTCSDSGQTAACSAANVAAITNETAYNGVVGERMGTDPMPLYFVAKTAGDVRTLEVWPSAAAKSSCVASGSSYSWLFSDGDGGKADIPFNFTVAEGNGCSTDDAANNPSLCLSKKLGTAADTMITQWFPFMAGDTRVVPSIAATCKYMVNPPNELWNPSQAVVDACQADTTGCKLMGNDPMNAARSYLFAKIYAGATNAGTSDPVLLALSDRDFSDNVIPTGSADLKYGYRTWTGGGETWTEVTSPERVDLGGCLQWPDWAQCQLGGCTTPQNPTIVAVGRMVTNYGPNAAASTDDNSWKCNMPEKRLLVANEQGYITLDGVKYLEAQPFITVSSVNKETWSQVCELTDTTPEPDATLGYQTFPADFTNAQIVTEAGNRQNGGSPEQQKGTMMGALYELITRAAEGGGSDSSPTFWNGTKSISCTDIKDGNDGAPINFETDIDPLFKSTHDSWQLSSLLKCVMIGIYNNKGTCSGVAPNITCDGTYGAVAADVQNQGADIAGFAESGTTGYPTIFVTLGTNSCLPKFQMTSLCTDGFCEPKVICSDYVAEDGGCSTGAQPASMMGVLKAEALPGNKFNFFEKSVRYDVRFDPGTSVNTVCQRSEFMTITSDAITAAPAAGFDIGMIFDNRESETNISSPDLDCQGQALSPTAQSRSGFKMYTTFTKQ